jgi:hypothetical protein
MLIFCVDGIISVLGKMASLFKYLETSLFLGLLTKQAKLGGRDDLLFSFEQKNFS